MSNEEIQTLLNKVLSLRRYSTFLNADPYDFEEMMDKVQTDLLQLASAFCTLAKEENKGIEYAHDLIEKVKTFIADGKRKNDIIGR